MGNGGFMSTTSHEPNENTHHTLTHESNMQQLYEKETKNRCEPAVVKLILLVEFRSRTTRECVNTKYR